MNEVLVEGRLSLFDGAGKGEDLSKTPAEVQPFSFILSYSQAERREKAGILPIQ
jgi:hypothetical protein